MKKTIKYFSTNLSEKKIINNFSKNISSTFDSNGSLLFSGRNIVKQFTLNDESNRKTDIIVKRFKKPNFIQSIIYGFFKRGKAKRAFFNASELRKRGINTPMEIAYVEETFMGLLGFSYFLSEPDFSSAIEKKFSNPKGFDKNLAKDFAVFMSNLHSKGILHNDLNSTNVLYKENLEGQTIFSLIDNNRMKFYPTGKEIPIEICFDNMTRFTGNMDLYSYVCKSYIECRKLPNPDALLKKALNIKISHDLRWARRKKITRKLKKIFKR